MVDYQKLRPNNLTSSEFRHLFLLLFWVLFGLVFFLVEHDLVNTQYHTVWCPLDDRIPFCEWFMIPYMFWFVFLVGMHVYLLLFDIPAFKRFMYFIVLTYGVTSIVYIVYPTCQNLRPESFERDNFLTHFIAGFYAFDTNTNVCPSLHVVGSVAAAFGAFDTKRFQTGAWRIAFGGVALLICFSTVFVKQHSIIDVFWAFALCAAAYIAVYALPKRKKEKFYAAKK